MYSFNELSESQKLTTEEKKTAKQILGLLNGQNQVAAKQKLDVVSHYHLRSVIPIIARRAE